MEFNTEIRTVYQTDKVGNYFVLKDKTPQTILPKVVYQFICPSDSETKYIGYTNRSLGERVKKIYEEERPFQITSVPAQIAQTPKSQLTISTF